jgi:hypothetical protein
LLHESPEYKPEGIKKVELVRIFLGVLFTGIRLFPLVGREPRQDIDEKSDKNKYQESADVDLEY